jgi:hypothetical protein
MHWVRYELDQIAVYQARQIRSILFDMPRIDDRICGITRCREEYSYREWWAMAWEYARADPNNVSKTHLIHLETYYPNPELDNEAENYPTTEQITSLIEEIDKGRLTYAQDCPVIAVRCVYKDGSARTYQAIMPEILRQHCRSGQKSARSAEY